jgi:[Skp1-protein]-hydroxyproline N-acetylglucosaminyltransferase
LSTVVSYFLIFRPRSPVFVRSNNFFEGVVDQIIDGEDDVCNAPIKPCDEDPKQALCQERWRQQIDVYQVDAPLSIGPVFARHLGHRMYRGEYYCTQSDAHVTFTQNWDEDALLQMESTHNEMAVLSTYLTDIQGSIDPETGASKRHTRPIMCNTHYEGGAQGMHLRHGSQPERIPSIHGMPQLQPWWAAGYSFSRGHFAVNVPYDPISPMIFQVSQMKP